MITTPAATPSNQTTEDPAATPPSQMITTPAVNPFNQTTVVPGATSPSQTTVSPESNPDTPGEKPFDFPQEVWDRLDIVTKNKFSSWLTARDKDMQQRGHRERDLEVKQLRELLSQYRQEFRGRCPQSLDDLTEEDTQKYTPFTTKVRMLIWYKHFVAGKTAVVNGKRESRVNTIEGYAGVSNRYRQARRSGETAKHPDLFDEYEHVEDHPLKDMKTRLNKSRGKLRKKQAVHQYHKFKKSQVSVEVLRSSAQRKKNWMCPREERNCW